MSLDKGYYKDDMEENTPPQEGTCMKREEGFYWIRTSCGGWQVAEWWPISKLFMTTCPDESYVEKEVEEISDRLLNPDEQADKNRRANRPWEDN